jgi:hypothetical protein
MRRLLLGMVAVLLVTGGGSALAAPTAATSSAGDGVITAAGDLTVTSDRAGKVRLRVPTDAVVDVDAVADPVGEGRFAGFVLAEPGTTDGLFIRVLRYPATLDWDAPVATSGRRAAEDRTPGANDCRQCRVPAGTYDLYLIADDTPVTVTLRLAGLDGATHLDASSLTPVPSLQVDGEERSGEAGLLGSGAAAWAMCCVDLEDGGIAFGQFASEVQTQTLSEASYTFCVKSADADACDRGFSRQDHTGVRGLVLPDNERSLTTSTLPPGRYQLQTSFSYRSATPMRWRLDADALFLGW